MFYTQILNTSKDGYPTACPGNLCQCLTPVVVKSIFIALKNEIFNLKCVFFKLRTEVVPACIQNGKNGKAEELLLSGLCLSDNLV